MTITDVMPLSHICDLCVTITLLSKFKTKKKRDRIKLSPLFTTLTDLTLFYFFNFFNFLFSLSLFFILNLGKECDVIFEEVIPDIRYTIIKNSEEEMKFTLDVIKIFKEIDTCHLTSKELLEITVQEFARTQE